MPWYLIGNGRTGECGEIEAPSAQRACELLGWVPHDCEVVQLRHGPLDESRGPLTMPDQLPDVFRN